MGYSQQQAESMFQTMLFPEEQSTCPVYCMFLSTGFFAKPTKFDVGYITCTTLGRILIAKNKFGGWSFGSLALRAAKGIKVKTNFAGQSVISAKFMVEGKPYELKVQIAPKVVGSDLPNQSRNLDRFLGTIAPFANQ
ncbi:MAG: hypothetical protein E7289_10190 [Lachnospiraceae bacterium]|nr:hypothetical protein [Lachnospiraceae bacterium]